jgi:RNA polymerase sigma-70 factor (ECF subfamily)
MMCENAQEIQGLLKAAIAGCQPSLNSLLGQYRERLVRMIRFRIDRRISARVDADDVLQEVYIQVSQNLNGYVSKPSVPFYLWLRGVAVNVLLEHHRRHLGTRMRDARLEVSLQPRPPLEASSEALVYYLATSGTSPSDAAMADEIRAKLKTLVDSLDPHDKEVLTLRHFEQLSPTETATVLQINEKAAGMRYVRAIKRLRQRLAESFGETSWWQI